jgi:hypothetical protein
MALKIQKRQRTAPMTRIVSLIVSTPLLEMVLMGMVQLT